MYVGTIYLCCLHVCLYACKTNTFSFMYIFYIYIFYIFIFLFGFFFGYIFIVECTHHNSLWTKAPAKWICPDVMHPWMSIWPPVCLSTCLLLSLPLALPVYVMQAGLHEGVNSSGIRAAHHTALCVTASNRLLEYLVDPFFFTSVLKAHEERLNGSLENEKKKLTKSAGQKRTDITKLRT